MNAERSYTHRDVVALVRDGLAIGLVAGFVAGVAITGLVWWVVG